MDVKYHTENNAAQGCSKRAAPILILAEDLLILFGLLRRWL
jgi:hypothetical protein